MQKLPTSYLFRQHTKEVITRWAGRLQYFYFIRAWGGHANDDDTFQSGILYKDRSDLENKLAMLGISPGSIGTNDPQPVPGKSYRGDELAKFKVRVYKYPDMEQPGLVDIGGQKVFLTVGSTAISFSVSGTADNNLYEVSKADFIACLKIEEVFDHLNWRSFKDTDFEQHNNCVSPSSYPELFSNRV